MNAMEEIRTQKKTVTPKIAEDLLEKNTANRPVSRREVDRLRRVLESGAWRMNGETVKLSRSGRILDGQHRLMAIAESGVAADMIIITGLEDESFSTIDQGRKRSGGDVLFIRGVKRHAAVSVACATLYRILKNRPIFGGVDQIPPYAIDEIFNRHPDIEQSVQLAAELAAKGSAVMGVGHIAAFHYLIAHVFGQSKKADAFVENITIGAGLDESSPILSFRKRVFEARQRKNVMQSQAKLALLAKIVGMYIEGRSVKALTQPATTATHESLIPGLSEAAARLEDRPALRDMSF